MPPGTSPIRAHHVVGDHLLQAVSKPLQTFLGVGWGDPYLNGTAMPQWSGTSHPLATEHRGPAQTPTCSQGRGHPRGCLLRACPCLGGQRSPAHRYNSVALAMLGQVTDATHEESAGGDFRPCLPRTCCYITSPAADRRRRTGTLTPPVGPALTTTKRPDHTGWDPSSRIQLTAHQCPGHSWATLGREGRPLPATCPPKLHLVLGQQLGHRPGLGSSVGGRSKRGS